MLDSTPLTSEEITDQCRALTYALINLEDPAIKEILTFMLAERLEHLNILLDTVDHLR